MQALKAMYKKVKAGVQKVYHKVCNSVAEVVVAGSLTVAGSAHAALPAEATAAFTTLSTNVSDIMSAIWPITAAAVGGFVLLKLFKKGANKAV